MQDWKKNDYYQIVTKALFSGTFESSFHDLILFVFCEAFISASWQLMVVLKSGNRISEEIFVEEVLCLL